MASTELLAGAAMAFGRGGLAGEEKREEREKTSEVEDDPWGVDFMINDLDWRYLPIGS
jgi:hypothetical protein